MSETRKTFRSGREVLTHYVPGYAETTRTQAHDGNLDAEADQIPGTTSRLLNDLVLAVDRLKSEVRR
jgi:hypothetical protein